MRGSITQERFAAGVVLLIPPAIVGAFWRMRSVDFRRYDALMKDDRLLENAQFAFYFAAGLVALWVSVRFFRTGDRSRALLFLAWCASCVFVAMEEISWGQRLLGVSSSEYFHFRNLQGETNVHNLLVFQPYLHAAYILVAGTLTILCLLPRGRLGERFWYLIPRRRLVFYFLPVFVFYAWFESYLLVTDLHIYPYDQELCEAVFAPGVFLFTLQILLQQGSSRRPRGPATLRDGRAAVRPAHTDGVRRARRRRRPRR